MKSIFLYRSIIMCSLFVLGACSHNLQPNEFIRYSTDPDNGLSSSIEHGAYKFELIYRPAELMALSDYNENAFSVDSVTARLGELEKSQVYHLRISAKEGADFLKTRITHENEYYERVAYYTSYAQQDLKLVQGRDTLNCSMYHFERSYGIQPFHTIILGFPNTDKDFQYNRTLLYKDRILGLETVEIELLSKNFRKIPNLSI